MSANKRMERMEASHLAHLQFAYRRRLASTAPAKL
jgi:hypothetical protein